jgi:hypothetical protein
MSTEQYKPFYDTRRQQFLTEVYYERSMEYWGEGLEEDLAADWNYRDSEYSCGEALRWSSIARNYWHMMNLHYTAGLPIEQMGEALEKEIAAIEKRAQLEADYFTGKNPPYIGGGEESYLDGLQHIGLAYLLHRRDLLPRIDNLMYFGSRKNNKNDAVYALLFRFNEPDRVIPKTYVNEDYIDLENTLYEENTKEEALADLTTYLKEWYSPLHETQSWYNTHTNLDGYLGYHGYWAYEAAALAYLLDLDDTSLHKFLYYPKDLVAYARGKPADSSPAPQPAPSVEPPPSRYTGYAVEVGQVCQETGSYECPRMEGRIVVLMQGQTVLGDKYNQMGAIIWYKLTKEAESEHLKKARFARSRG